jgi:DNA-binding NarL/FixJ family response regulator
VPELQVLILTVYEDSESIFDALKAGASGYLLKRSSPAEILAAIRDVQPRRRTDEQPDRPQARDLPSKLPPPPWNPRASRSANAKAKCSAYITKGYTGKEIADKMHVSINTVKTHLKHIYQKLHVRSRTEILLRFHSSQPGD